MGYIGNTPADKFLTLAKQSFSTSATTSYTLDSAVSSTQDIALFINNVRQSPVDAYTVSGTSLTLSSATAGTDEMYCVYLGKTVGTVSPASDSVTTAMLQANAVTGAKLNTDVISAQTALGATPADTDELLVSDAGVLKRVDYSYLKAGNMTPMFLATATTDQSSLSDNTATKRIFNSEIFDSNNAYDTSTGLFTVPTTAKYLFVAGLNIDGGGSSNGDQFAIHLSRDSDASGVAHSFLKFTGNYLNRNDANIAAIKSLSANETVGVYGRMQTAGGSWNMYGGQNINYFGGFKIIE